MPWTASPQIHEIVEPYCFRVSFLSPPPRDSLSEWVTIRFYFDCLGHQEFKDIAHDGLWELTPLTLLPLLTLLKLLILLTLTLYYECFFGREVRFP